MTDETQVEPAPAVEAEPAPAVDETNEAPAPETPPEPTIPKSRFDEVYRHRREAERDRDYWRELAMRNNAPAPKEPEPLIPPTPEQHGFDDAKYQTALTEYNKQIARSEAISVIQAERAKEQQQVKAQTFRQREAEFAEKNPDYRDKVYNNALPISQAAAELIAESEDGPAVALYLANNPDVAAELYELPPVKVAREIGRIEARLSQPKEAPKPKPVLTSAPPPPPKLETSDASTISVKPTDPESDKELSDAEWMKQRERQLRKKTGNR